MQPLETNLGYLIETPELLLLMGGVKANFINLQASYPQYEFLRVKQTHSDIVVESNDVKLDYQIEADAHFTSLIGTALCISTADCIPVFVFDSERKTIAGIHAGWRGVANQIVPKTLQRLFREGSLPENLKLFVGPHIQKNSFEVGASVRDELLQTVDLSVENAGASILTSLSEEKGLLDLNQILHLQLKRHHISEEQIFDFQLDTFIDPRFHSHRRDKERAGRQLSFICMK